MVSILLILSILVAIPVVIYALEILLALLPLRKITIPGNMARPAIAVLVPAHNESGTLEKTLLNISQQLSDKDRILVVADNCTDDTAGIARQHGAEVIERFDTDRRGKGYALDYGIRHLEKDPPQVVIIIDADCLADEGALALLTSMTMTSNRPVQALYLMRYNTPTMKQRIAEFAWLVKNYVRPRGLSNIGLPCQLMGTGMAFPWGLISDAELATGNIVEDVKMGLDMAAAGHAPLYCPAARVTSTFPDMTSAEQTQRKRWEHGHLNTIVSEVPRGLIRAARKADLNILALILDLAVPPLALLALALFGVFFASLLYAMYEGVYLPVYFNIALFFLFFTTTLVAWYAWGRKVISLLELSSVPFYIAKKVPLYLSFLVKKEKSWVRTDRDEK